MRADGFLGMDAGTTLLHEILNCGVMPEKPEQQSCQVFINAGYSDVKMLPSR
jgi:hypothetical protein